MFLPVKKTKNRRRLLLTEYSRQRHTPFAAALFADARPVREQQPGIIRWLLEAAVRQRDLLCRTFRGEAHPPLNPSIFRAERPSQRAESAVAARTAATQRPACQKGLNKLANGNASPLSCVPSPVFALKMELFTAKSHLAPSYTPPDTFENSRGFNPFEHSEGFSTV